MDRQTLTDKIITRCERYSNLIGRKELKFATRILRNSSEDVLRRLYKNKRMPLVLKRMVETQAIAMIADRLSCDGIRISYESREWESFRAFLRLKSGTILNQKMSVALGKSPRCYEKLKDTLLNDPLKEDCGITTGNPQTVYVPSFQQSGDKLYKMSLLYEKIAMKVAKELLKTYQKS